MRHDLDRALTLTAAWTIFLLSCVYPIAWMLVGSPAGRVSDAAEALAGPRQSALISQTLLLGVGTAFGALVVGLPFGVALGRCDPSRVALPRFVLLVPVVLPAYALALAWVLIAETPLGTWTYGLPAATVVLAFSFYPIVMLVAEAATRGVAQRLEEAGRLVASPWRVWANITLPLLARPLAAVMLVVFVLAISDFAVPSMLRVRVFTTEIFTAFSALYDFRLATVMAIPLAFIGALAAAAAFEMSRRPSVGRFERGRAGVRWTPRLQQVANAALCVAGFSAVLIPTGAIALRARSSRGAIADTLSVDAIRNGLIWSASAATVIVMIAILLGYWRARTSSRAGHVAEMFWVMLFAVPATVAGIGVVGVWNRPGIMGDVYRSPSIVLIAYVSRFLPLAAILCAAFLRRVPAALEEAALVSGAPWRRAFARIVLPLGANGFAAVWLVMFILTFGDVSLAILVAPPGESNLAVRAYTLMANSPVSDVAAIALAHITISVLPLAALMFLMRRMRTP